MTASLVLTMLTLQACGSKSVCPSYPKPSQNVLTKIKSLKSQDVDDWILKQFKLNKKLEVCNESYFK
jgi:hypothetical protein